MKRFITNCKQLLKRCVNRNRFMTLVIGVITVSSIFVTVAMGLYASSGAAQVDLSRPGFKAVRKDTALPDSQEETFSATGGIDKLTLQEYQRLYAERTKGILEADGFAKDVLSPEALSISRSEAMTAPDNAP